MKFDKYIVGYLAISAVVCAGITVYNKNSSVPVSKPAEPEIRTSAEITTLESVTETAGAEETAEKAEKPKTDLAAEVTYAFVDSFGIPHVVVKNNAEQLYGYTLSLKYFDKDKNEIAENTAEIEAVVPAGLSEGLDRFLPKVENAEYIAAAVTELKYPDETKTQEPYFNTDLAAMSDIRAGRGSAVCSFINIGKAGIVRQQGGSDLSDLRFDITNNSDRAINSMEFLVAEYDKNGAPVSAKPNGYVRENVRKLSWDGADLDPGSKKSLAGNMALNSGCASVKIIVNHIEFRDRGVWANPDTLDWILSQGGND